MTASNTDNYASLVRSKSRDNPLLATGKKNKRRKTKKKMDYSKQIIHDIRYLLWIVTIGSLALGFYCVFKGSLQSLPWITALVGLPWSAHSAISCFYINMAKSDHKEGAITFEAAKANSFQEEVSMDSPPI